MHGNAMTPTQAESYARQQRFRARIAAMAARVETPEKRVHFIPNTPYGVPKVQPGPKAPNKPLHAEWFYHHMWFFDLVQERKAGPRLSISIREIQMAVCRHYGISLTDLLSARRDADTVRIRQLAIFLAKRMTLRSLNEIGRHFANRDHTTVLHAFRKIEKLIRTDEKVAHEIATLEAQLT